MKQYAQQVGMCQIRSASELIMLRVSELTINHPHLCSFACEIFKNNTPYADITRSYHHMSESWHQYPLIFNRIYPIDIKDN